MTINLDDIRKVTLHFIGGTSPTTYLVPVSEVETFVEASKRLHFNPGVNPHNGNETARIWQITVAEMKCRGPFWWTVPDLQNNGDPRGAHIIDGGAERTVFLDKETVARWDAERAEEEAKHYRELERQARVASAGSLTQSQR